MPGEKWEAFLYTKDLNSIDHCIVRTFFGFIKKGAVSQRLSRMEDMILAASIILVLVNCAQSSFLPHIDAPIYDLRLSSDLLFQWQVDYKTEEIYVEVTLFRHQKGTYLIFLSALTSL